MILAIDTSTQWLSIALYDWENEVFPYEKTWRSSRRHTTELAPAVDKILIDSGITADNLKAVAIATGPGSFTSLRIGLAFAKGMALVNHLDLIGIPSLDILAATVPPASIPLICILQAGRKNLAACRYHFDEMWKEEGETFVTTPQELSENIYTETIICGEMDHEMRRIIGRKWKKAQLCSPSASIRRASTLAELASIRLSKDMTDDPALLAPIYLHTINSIPVIE
ncbi:MAG TPA: tRNA (adenosine(37)-N6)-threonylcarbamoyltransferase complex dimerization subunit type 1 TsaB [Anaerolineaceae bacterium]|uniref:Peptidase M22 family protein n=1 Tax=Anaerolinea thermophila TaxID=167964 RepID=A0A117LGV6_9CHLR|nr:MAG: Peptidase M22 family protein [Anaerolinea thermophila]HAF61116.1 tRNA (adenosine(37)-N6)-threonylcarbamoyltransferase complex dimerization subunit type 1 TsaB [Anaerolineaceae bacterium]